MQVAHQHDFDTHAVIGGREVQAYGIAQTAEMYDILSNALYSNKPLAVVREYLCNANDAHIVSGRTHIPIEVLLDDDKMIIRDYGYGIPHDQVHEIFCVYGKSTKQSDGRQTGGFGLGSKSGFAYSDHFTVTNHHQGTKVVHAISRGSALTNGEPDRRVIVEVPTTEEGLEVQIPLRSTFDREKFRRLILELASFGEMNVLLNGEPVKTVPISSAENNMFATQREVPHNSEISIRYGYVVYPVPMHEEYGAEYRILTEWLSSLRAASWGPRWRCILQAQPSTISVTPSRESLSLTETTIKTLKGLLGDLNKHINGDIHYYLDQADMHARTAYEKLCAAGRPEQVLYVVNPLYGETYSEDITNQEKLAKHYCSQKSSYYTSRRGNKLRLDVLIEQKYGRVHDLKLYRKMLDHGDKLSFSDEYLKKRVVRPLLKRLALHEKLKPENLLVAPAVHSTTTTGNFEPVSDYWFVSERIPDVLLSGVVIVTYSKLAYLTDYTHKRFHNKQDRLVYVSPRNPKHKDAAVAFFTKMGFTVIDFADAWDQIRKQRQAAQPALPVVKVKKEPKPEGLPSMTNLRSSDGLGFVCRGLVTKQQKFLPIEYNPKPEYVFKGYKLSEKAWDKRFFSFGDDVASLILSLFGTRGAVCSTELQYDKAIQAGMKDGYEFLVEELSKEMLSNPRIKTHYSIKTLSDFPNNTDPVAKVVKLGAVSDKLRATFDLPEALTSQDNLFVVLYDYLVSKLDSRMAREGNTSWVKPMKALREEVQKWKASPELVSLFNKIHNNRCLKTLNLSEMTDQLEKAERYGRKEPRLRTFIEISVLSALG